VRFKSWEQDILPAWARIAGGGAVQDRKSESAQREVGWKTIRTKGERVYLLNGVDHTIDFNGRDMMKR
jgi:hypothetical protein